MKVNTFASSTFNNAARLLLTFTVLFGSASIAFSATLNWDGGHGAWSNPSNWDPTGVPSDGDTLVFPNHGLNADTTNDIVGLNLDTIRISANMDLYGNSVGVSSEIFVFTSSSMPSPTMTVDMDIELNADVTITAHAIGSFNSTLSINGDIDTGSHTLSVGDTGIHTGAPVYLYGSVSGSGSVIKFGDGTVYMAGSLGNTYSGLTTVEEGTLVLDKDSGNAVPGSLIIGGNDASDPTATVLQQSLSEIGSSVTINRQGTYDMNGYNESIYDLNLNGGADIDTGSATLTIHGDVTVDGGVSSINGLLSLYSGSHDFNILFDGLVVWPGAHCYLDADVSGSGGLIKKGPGNMRLMGNNIYAGTTVVENGYIMIESNTALGTTAGGTTVNPGSWIYLSAFSQASSKNIVGETLSLGGNIYSYGVANTWDAPVTLTDNVEIKVVPGRSLELSGVIDGSGGVTKTSTGTLVYSGSGNDYSGDTTVEAGVLELAAINAIRYGILTIGDGAGAMESVAVRFLASSPIHSAADVIIQSDGLLDFNNYSDDLGYVLFDRGRLSTGTGTYQMNADIEVIESFETNWTAMISGFVDLRTSPKTFNVHAGAFLDLSAPTEGSGGITKTGGGRLRLGWPNTYTGTTIAQEGYLQLWHAGSLGATNGGTVVQSGATLEFGKSLVISNEVLELNGLGAPNYGALDTIYDAGWVGSVVLNTDSEIYVSSGTLEIDGAISGSGGLMKVAGGTLAFTGNDANTYAGDTYVDVGTLSLEKTIGNSSLVGNLYIGNGSGGADADVVRLENVSQIPNSTRITMASSGLFDLNNINEYFGSLEGSGHVTLGNAILRTGLDASSTVFSGLIEGSGQLQKHGVGTFTLDGNNSYVGDTTVILGTLLVNGSQPGSDVIVDSSGTLGGIGTVGAITSDGSVAPGNSAGQLGSGSATLNSGSSFDVELDGYNPVDHDQLDVNGLVSLGNADLNIAWGFVPAVGDEFTIVENDGGDAVSGTFNGLAEGASVAAGNVTLQITYAGGTGNDVVLETTQVDPLEDLVITSIDTSSGNVDLEWAGGVPFFRVEKKNSLTNGTWTAATAPTRDFTDSVPADTTNGFYRVTGGN